eukprot:Rmarinus@m.11338
MNPNNLYGQTNGVPQIPVQQMSQGVPNLFQAQTGFPGGLLPGYQATPVGGMNFARVSQEYWQQQAQALAIDTVEKTAQALGITLCQDYLRRECRRGNACRFSHRLPQGDVQAILGKSSGTKEVCQEFLRGVCRRGSACKYRHEKVTCQDFLRGKCRRENCQYAHERVPCRDFLRGTCTKGDNCIYSHEAESSPSAELCKDYLRGSCNRGTTCRYRHDDSARENLPICRDFQSGVCARPNCTYRHVKETAQPTHPPTETTQPPANEGTAPAPAADDTVPSGAGPDSVPVASQVAAEGNNEDSSNPGKRKSEETTLDMAGPGQELSEDNRAAKRVRCEEKTE